MKKIYIDINQNVNSILMQKNEITFEFMSANFTRRIDLKYQQLHVFVMRYHCEILKKFNKKNLLTKLKIRLNTMKLR